VKASVVRQAPFYEQFAFAGRSTTLALTRQQCLTVARPRHPVNLMPFSPDPFDFLTLLISPVMERLSDLFVRRDMPE
jgi:hypothetical protein